MRRPGRRHLLWTDMRRSWGRLSLAGLGIVVACAALIFLVGLAEGVRTGVIERMIPDDRLEVGTRPSHIDLGPLRMDFGREVLDESDLKALADLGGVSGVYPKVWLGVPATAAGGASLLGQTMVTEIVVDGIDPSLVADDVGSKYSFSARMIDGVEAIPCAWDPECPAGLFCVDSGDGTSVCREPIPVLAATHLVELYNGTVRRAYGLPRLNPEAVLGLTAEVRFGGSSFSGSSRSKIIRDRLQLVGFSDRAAPLGLTLPLDEVSRLNEIFSDGGRPAGFDTAVLTLDDASRLGSVAGRVRDMGLRVVNEEGERAAAVMGVAVVVLLLLGGAIIVPAALGVLHTFALLVQGRRREIAVLRAIGASIADVSMMLLGEAAVVGAMAGTIGIGLGIGTARVVDAVAMRSLESLPFVPDTLFIFSGTQVLAVLAVAIIGAVAGALVPIWRAVHRPPAETL